MHGYFQYKFYGTKNEVEEALNLIINVSKGDLEVEYLSKCACKDLLDFNKGISTISKYNLVKGSPETHVLHFDCGSSGNINNLNIDFELMPYISAKIFTNLRSEGCGYLLDCPPYEKFSSERGSDEYTIGFKEMACFVDGWSIDEDGDVNVLCPCCEEDISFNVYSDGKELLNSGLTCESCEVPIVFEFDADIDLENIEK